MQFVIYSIKFTKLSKTMKFRSADVRHWIAIHEPMYYVDLYIIDTMQVDGAWYISDLKQLLPNSIIQSLESSLLFNH